MAKKPVKKPNPARKKLGPQAGRVRAALSGVRPTPKAGKGK